MSAGHRRGPPHFEDASAMGELLSLLELRRQTVLQRVEPEKRPRPLGRSPEDREQIQGVGHSVSATAGFNL